MANNGPPWNKGKKGLAAGWTPERRLKASRFKTAWLKANPDSPLGQKGPRPNIWSTGPDPHIHKHRYRFLKARAQAKYWSQEWTILWEDFLDLLKTAPGEWSRDKNALNITRIDTTKGWHIWNVRLMRRVDAMRRPNKGKHRIQPKGKGSKKKGINWRRGGHKKDEQ